jgi:hypothetical protein
VFFGVHTVSGITDAVGVPADATTIGSPVVSFIPAVVGGHYIAVTLSVACCWVSLQLLASLLLLGCLLLIASYFC